MTVGKGFVTQTAFKKHLDGDWRTVHELWSHIRNYMSSYAAPDASTYSKTEVDAFFEGYSGGKAQVDAGNVVGLTQGSIPFADASGFLTEDNSNLFWDASNLRLGIGTSSPATDCALHIEFSAVEVVVSRLTAKTRPWRQWECVDGNWGLAIGIHADDGKIHFNYDSPIGTKVISMIVFDGPNGRVGILDATPSYPLDIGGSTRIQSDFRVINQVTFESTLDVTGNTTLSKLIVTGNGEDAINLTGTSAQIHFIGGAGDKGINYKDTGATQRYAMRFPSGSDVVEILNRASNGTVEIHANTATAGAAGDVLVVTIEDTDVTLANGIGFNLQEDITFTGATAQNLIKFPDNLVTALSFREGANAYLTFKTTDAAEAVIFGKVFTGVSGSTIGNLTFANGSITDSGGAISFGNENLSTTGTLDAGVATFTGLTVTDYIYFDKDTEHVMTIGYQCGNSLAGGGTYNYLMGEQAGYSLTTGDHNVAIGFQADYFNATGNDNICIGYQAGYGVETNNPPSNIFIGYRAGYLVIEGQHNVCIGRHSGYNIGEGDQNFFLGNTTGENNSGLNNIAIGYRAFRGSVANTAGHNINIGHDTGYDTVTGAAYNINIGIGAGYRTEASDYNINIGYLAGYGTNAQSSGYNIFFGAESGRMVTTGNRNVCIGHKAGRDITSGTYNVCIGYMAAEGQLTTGSHQLWIANSDTATPLIYGEFPNTLLRINAPLDIGRDGALRGALTLWDGAGGNTPGYVKIHSPDGTAWYVFVEDDGTVKIHNAAPAANADGDAIGDQTD